MSCLLLQYFPRKNKVMSVFQIYKIYAHCINKFTGPVSYLEDGKNCNALRIIPPEYEVQQSVESLSQVHDKVGCPMKAEYDCMIAEDPFFSKAIGMIP